MFVRNNSDMYKGEFKSHWGTICRKESKTKGLLGSVSCSDLIKHADLLMFTNFVEMKYAYRKEHM